MPEKATSFFKIDRNTFKDLFHLYFQPLSNLGYQYLDDREEAKEVVQDAYLKLWELRDELSPDSNISNFLFTLVKNRCLNILKQRQVRLKHHDQIRWLEMKYQFESLSRLTDGFLEYNELKENLNLAVERLPKHCRVVFEMSRSQDLKNREIAEKLEVSQKTVEAHLTKALKILRIELKQYLPIIPILIDFLN
ncbi:RNA polymerase sigma-70 factor [Sunxiuqinia sp. A32]|uniref:RNA polymerase sigma-70 factor n=1 Tax=Sunxiuqinia sp. A32 TaxID=3461496 RepID=UPI00404646B8